MGCTDDSIFIPPELVREHGVENDDLASGLAVINFDKKKRERGWKAILLVPVEEHRKVDKFGCHVSMRIWNT